MADIGFTRAAGAYQDALRAANNILDRVAATSSPQASNETQAASFFDMVGGALKSAASNGYRSEEVATRALSGKADLTDVVTAVSEAENALNTVVAVRDRVISAYQDIIKMPI